MGANKYLCTCEVCGKQFWAGSVAGKICDNPACRKVYEETRRAKKREWERGRARIRTKKVAEPIRKAAPGNLLEDVRKAEELGMSYGQYKANQNRYSR